MSRVRLGAGALGIGPSVSRFTCLALAALQVPSACFLHYCA